MNTSKIRSFLLLLAIFGGFFFPGTTKVAGQANTSRYISPGGNDTGACTNKNQPCRTIQYAVDQSASGDEVRLASGEYAAGEAPIAFLVIGLTLRGGYSTSNWELSDKAVNPTTLKVSCEWDSYDAAIRAASLEPVTIKDLDIDGCGIRADAGLLVERVSIKNGQIRHSAGANSWVTLTDVTIDGGNFVHASGSQSLATLTHVTITNSPEEGIREVSAGGLVLSDTQILNSAGVGILFANGALPPSSVTRTLVQGNGAGIVDSCGSVITLDQVMILGNKGRGIMDKSAGMVMTHVTIQGNHAVRDDEAFDFGDGGGYYTINTQSILTDVVIRGNTSVGSGGGIYDASGGMTLVRTTVVDNQAALSGGGIWSEGVVTLAESAVTGNQAPGGGGIFCASCQLNLTNSAVSANTGGGIVTENGPLMLLNSLVAGNSGVGLQVVSGIQPVLDFDNTLLALNTGGNCDSSISLDGNHNLSSDALCSFFGESNWTETAPHLGGLLSNGFYGMSSSGPAVDHGDPALCPAIDYRGFPRPIDGNGDGVAVCDIGPLEVALAVFLPIVIH